VKESLQFGYRNDAWVSIDEAKSELDYLITNGSEGKK